MDLLTFGQVILFEGGHYVWLVPDLENDELHLAKILDEEKTKELLRVSRTSERKLHSTAYQGPLFAYVILSTKDFNGLAAHLMKSNEHVENGSNYSVMGSLNDEDVSELRQRILDGTGLPPRLVNLVKKLNG